MLSPIERMEALCIYPKGRGCVICGHKQQNSHPVKHGKGNGEYLWNCEKCKHLHVELLNVTMNFYLEN
jgi:hypothetical protein